MEPYLIFQILVIYILQLLSTLDAHPPSQRNESLVRNPRACSIKPYDVECHGQCPTGDDGKEYNAIYKNCTDGTIYHCNKENGTRKFVEVCAVPVQCEKGKEPLIQFSPNNKKFGAIRCEDCKNGTFNKEKRWSNSYTQCKTKTPCNSFGQLKCEEPPGREKLWTDSACTCDYESGLSPPSVNTTCMPGEEVQCGFNVLCNGTEVLISNFTCVQKCPANSNRSKTGECISTSGTVTDMSTDIATVATTLSSTVLQPNISTTLPLPDYTDRKADTDSRNIGLNGMKIGISVSVGLFLFLLLYCCIGRCIYKKKQWEIVWRPNNCKSVWFWPCRLCSLELCSGASQQDQQMAPGNNIPLQEIGNNQQMAPGNNIPLQEIDERPEREPLLQNRDERPEREPLLQNEEQNRVLNRCIIEIKAQMEPKLMLDYFRSQELLHEYGYKEIADLIANKGSLDANDKIVDMVRKNNYYYTFKNGLKIVKGHDSLIKVLEEKEQQVHAERREKANWEQQQAEQAGDQSSPTDIVQPDGVQETTV